MLLLSIIFLALGLLVLYLFLASFWSGISELFPKLSLKSFFRKRLLGKLALELDKIDAAIKVRNAPVAQTLILQSLKLDSPLRAKYHFETSIQHNFSLLSKSVHLLDIYNVRAHNLAILEREIQSRASLLKLYSDAVSARHKIARKDSSVESKKWALQEMDAKIASILLELDQNAAAILREMKTLLALANTTGSASGVKYH